MKYLVQYRSGKYADWQNFSYADTKEEALQYVADVRRDGIPRSDIRMRKERQKSDREPRLFNPVKRPKKGKLSKRIPAALTRFLKRQNPSKMKGVTRVRVKKLKGGGVTITPAR